MPDVVDVLVLAPKTPGPTAAHFIAEHPDASLIYTGAPEPFVACVALHKSGTNLLTAVLQRLGYIVSGEGTGRSPYPDGLWEAHESETLAALSPGTAYVAHSLPLPAIGGPREDPRPLFRTLCSEEWPVVFHYRDPRAVLASLVRYLSRPRGEFTEAPFHLMVSRVLRSLAPAQRLDFAIANLGAYLSWSFDDSSWLLDAPFILRSSYEVLVGQRGGSDQAAATDWVAHLMLRLQVGGDPASVAATSYDQTSRTFDRGSATGWRQEYTGDQLSAFNDRYADILRRYGYPHV